MKLGVISDTHGNVLRTRRALEIFKERQVTEILHCGDVGSKQIVEILSEIPTFYVYGNTDARSFLRAGILHLGERQQVCCETVGMLAREGRQIVFLHGTDWQLFDDLLTSQRYDLICSGHTHEAHWEIQGKTYLLNPGALERTPSPSVAVLTLPEMRVEHIRVL